MNSAENVRRCLLIRHLSHGEDFRLNRCPGSVDHYNVALIVSRFGKRSPAPEMVIRSLAEATRKVIVAHGARSANALGLTRQVPVRLIFLTSGRSRVLYLGKTEIVIKHAPKWQMILGDSFAGEAIRALASMGPLHSHESAAKLKKLLPLSEWQALQSTRSLLPAWMAKLI
ncbi:DUF6088 family protein [Pseudomonas aeruginosa]|uniref:DUF6088 family protein n=1 Tax=Pseudomonas aeruginosa TaxID=287 RepID=UPI00338F5026